ncbi:MAG: glutathione S-transferase family protein [Rhizobium sp.]|nr:glutathione S-transferase family protein [Rhizobium sp.]
MLKIYGVYKSRATRTFWLAGELGLTFEHVPVLQAYKLADPMAPRVRTNTRSPEFLAINPMGAIPAIDDDGLRLYESMAINLHLAKKHGGPLAPRDLAEDALITQWSFFAVSEMEANALKISMANAQGRLATEAGQAEADVASRLLKRPFGVLEQHFAGNDYAVGGRFTVADLNLAEVVRYAEPYAPALKPFPHLSAWLKRCHERPAFKAMWQARLDEQE